jgi:hypothetical protein
MSDHDFGPFDDHEDPLPYDETPAPDDTPLFEHDDHELWSQDDDPAAHDSEFPGHGSEFLGDGSEFPGYGSESSGHGGEFPGYGGDLAGHDDGLSEHDIHPSGHDIESSPHSESPPHSIPEMSETRGAEGTGGSDGWDDPGHDGHPGWDDPGHVAWDDPEAAAADHVDVFPPALDVGELPEPVDGFPWIDTGSLGVVDPGPTVEHLDPVRAEELAAYAGEELPPGQDPWAALAGSDDPATSALARWWTNH